MQLLPKTYMSKNGLEVSRVFGNTADYIRVSNWMRDHILSDAVSGLCNYGLTANQLMQTCIPGVGSLSFDQAEHIFKLALSAQFYYDIMAASRNYVADHFDDIVKYHHLINKLGAILKSTGLGIALLNFGIAQFILKNYDLEYLPETYIEPDRFVFLGGRRLGVRREGFLNRSPWYYLVHWPRYHWHFLLEHAVAARLHCRYADSLATLPELPRFLQAVLPVEHGNVPRPVFLGEASLCDDHFLVDNLLPPIFEEAMALHVPEEEIETYLADRLTRFLWQEETLYAHGKRYELSKPISWMMAFMMLRNTEEDRVTAELTRIVHTRVYMSGMQASEFGHLPYGDRLLAIGRLADRNQALKCELFFQYAVDRPLRLAAIESLERCLNRSHDGSAAMQDAIAVIETALHQARYHDTTPPDPNEPTLDRIKPLAEWCQQYKPSLIDIA